MMKRMSLTLAATALIGAAPAKEPPPVANYWMDVATVSGMGAGMMGGGGKPDMAQAGGPDGGQAEAALAAIEAALGAA